MAGITQNKQECLISIVVPWSRKKFIRSEQKEEHSTFKKLIFIKFFSVVIDNLWILGNTTIFFCNSSHFRQEENIPKILFFRMNFRNPKCSLLNKVPLLPKSPSVRVPKSLNHKDLGNLLTYLLLRSWNMFRCREKHIKIFAFA